MRGISEFRIVVLDKTPITIKKRENGQDIESRAFKAAKYWNCDVEIWHYPDYDKPRRLTTIKKPKR